MMNWNAVRFIDCALCCEPCEPMKVGGVLYESVRSICGYCVWRFHRGRLYDKRKDLDVDTDFAHWAAKELERLAKAQINGRKRSGSWRGRKNRYDSIREAARRAGVSRRRYGNSSYLNGEDVHE